MNVILYIRLLGGSWYVGHLFRLFLWWNWHTRHWRQKRALLAKWIWQYYHEEGAINDSSWPSTSFPEHIKGPWRSILTHLNLIKERISIKVGNGSNTSFWHDHRIHTAPLSNLYPRLYTLASHKLSTASNWIVGLHTMVGPPPAEGISKKMNLMIGWLSWTFLMEFG